MLMLSSLLSAPMASSESPSAPMTKEIAPGLFMPYVNLGGVHSHPSNYSAWLAHGGVGLDTAMMYGDDVQLHVGDAIKKSGIPREKIFLTTKVPCCPEGGLGTKWCKWYDSEYPDLDAFTRGDIDLRLLGVDRVDLMLLHWPCGTITDTIKTWRALERFQKAGKARAIGISNFNASAIDSLYAAGLSVEPVVNQCGFSIGGHNSSTLGRDDATLAKCKEKGITHSAYSPLGGLSHVDVLRDPRVATVAAAHPASPRRRWPYDG